MAAAIAAAKAAVTIKQCTVIIANLSAEQLNSDAAVLVKFPFLDNKWTASALFLGSAQPSLKLSKFGTSGANTTVAITGRVFNIPGWKVQIGSNLITPTVLGDTILTFDITKAIQDSNENVVVIPPYGGTPVVLPLKFKPEEADPSLKEGQVETTKVNFSESVTFEGTALDKVKEVTFEGNSLQFVVKEKGTKIVIYLTRKVTEKAGTIQVLLKTENPSDTPIPATIKIN